MSSTVDKVSSVRLHVEAVEVEVDEDGGLQWTALQAAFPGSSGIHYSGKECRSAVKFDGKKFLPPGGNWNDRQYYVALGRPPVGGAPFQSYDAATKTFERSVSVVQRMLAGFESPRARHHKHSGHSVSSTATSINNTPAVSPDSPVRMTREETPVSKRSHSSLHSSASTIPPTPIPSTPLPSLPELDVRGGLQERESLLRCASRALSPIEQQFIDLAKIANAKDTIIEQLRLEINALKEKAAAGERTLLSAQSEFDRISKRCEAQEEELTLLRGLGREQTSMCEKVNSLTSRLLEKEEELQSVRRQLEDRLKEQQGRIGELQQDSTSLSSALSAAKDAIASMEGRQADMEKQCDEQKSELATLRPLREAIGAEDPSAILTYTQAIEEVQKAKEQMRLAVSSSDEVNAKHAELNNVFEGVLKDNTRLKERNEALEQRFENLELELFKINTGWETTLKEKEQEWKWQVDSLQSETDSLREQCSSQQRLLDAAAADAAAQAARADESSAMANEARRQLEHANRAHQRQLADAFADRLAAEREVRDMQTLLQSMINESNDQQRDVTDLIR